MESMFILPLYYLYSFKFLAFDNILFYRIALHILFSISLIRSPQAVAEPLSCWPERAVVISDSLALDRCQVTWDMYQLVWDLRTRMQA